MKIDRLIGILSILLQQDKVTAPYLAEKFEVSRRTIMRDIEHLCKAGIPLVTTQGQQGGISIMEGYTMDRTLFTSKEMQSILIGLKGLDSVAGTNQYQCLMDKLSMKQNNIQASNSHIQIDLSSWHKSSLTTKIEKIQEAIEKSLEIKFQYYAPKGESERIIEPYVLIFQWASWYIYGYCKKRKEYRLFKLNRMQQIDITETKFLPRPAPEIDFSEEEVFPTTIEAKVAFIPEVKWRLIENYGMDSFTINKDGRLFMESGFTDKENLFYWLLSFGNQVELLEPEGLREEFKRLLEEIQNIYKTGCDY
ncbi:MAG: YafY family transcriptional regulator [Lachnospiraceae bacterium]|nr:YafY family transcriptional regulator [Lachnospiraceae bacterium]